MKHPFILAAFAVTIAGLPANAQPVAADLLPAYEVTTIVTSMGMRPIGRPAWHGGRYILAAVDRYGREVNVVLDARDGQVIAVRPLPRNSFGAPPPQAGPGPAPQDPRFEGGPPPRNGAPLPPAGAVPPPADGDDEFFDNDRQQGSVTPPRAPARTAPPRDPATTGSVVRSAPVAPKEGAASKDAAKEATPMPRPRPALARANDPSVKDAVTNAASPAPAGKKESDKAAAEKKSAATNADEKKATKPEGRDARADASKPDAAKPDAAKSNVRVIDLSKPKTDVKKDDKPGQAIRF